MLIGKTLTLSHAQLSPIALSAFVPSGSVLGQCSVRIAERTVTTPKNSNQAVRPSDTERTYFFASVVSVRLCPSVQSTSAHFDCSLPPFLPPRWGQKKKRGLEQEESDGPNLPPNSMPSDAAFSAHNLWISSLLRSDLGPAAPHRHCALL